MKQNFSEFSGDHRHGPLAVPGPQECGPWGMRQFPLVDPDPWPGFGEWVISRATQENVEDLYVFVHSRPSSPPTVSSGRGSYYYWPVAVVNGHHCYLTLNVETGSHDEKILTIHIAPRDECGGALVSSWMGSMEAQ